MGNAPGGAVLETLLGGLVLDAVQDQVFAVAGTPAPLTITAVTGAERSQDVEAPFALLAGESITVVQPASGFRSYVAFLGGLDVSPVLSS